MMKFCSTTSLLLFLAAMLAACNGGEDFEDAIGGPVTDGSGGSSFVPTDACASRTIGNFVDGGIVRNLAYRCDGFYGKTGFTGLDSEKEQNYFVCPRSATSVDFFIGGKLERLHLGTARFRTTAEKSTEGCSYDADGPYLFSVADLFDAPARVDVSATAYATRAQNISALLTGLDGTSGDEFVDVHDQAHSLIAEGDYVFEEAQLDLPFAEFVDSTGVAQQFLDAIELRQPGVTGSFPSNSTEAQESLSSGADSTAAGIYRFEMFYEIYGYIHSGLLGSACENCVPDKVAVSDVLVRDIPNYWLADPGDSASYDKVLDAYLEEFYPLLMADRQGHVLGGGAFETVDLTGTDGSQYLCDLPAATGRTPDFLSLDGDAALLPTLQFSSFSLASPLGTDSSLTLPGRFINGLAYNGITSSAGTPDYEYHYPDLPADAHEFDAATDKTMFSGTLCGQGINDQVVLGFGRIGAVTPQLDREVMDHFFTEPGRYTLGYMRRSDPAAPDPPETWDETTGETLRITIHSDGAIFTDLGPDGSPDGNPGYPDSEPPGEYRIGMVTSVFRGIDDSTTDGIDESVTEAGMNLLLLNVGPASAELLITRYGSHFRGRLVPGDGACDVNRLFAASDEAVITGQLPYWFDPYAVTEYLRTYPTASPEEKYAMLRTEAYGHVGAVDYCPSSP